MNPATNGATPQTWIRGCLQSYGVRAVMNPRALTFPDPGQAPRIKAELARRGEDGRSPRKLIARWCPHGRTFEIPET